jgi:hypothetical protein
MQILRTIALLCIYTFVLMYSIPLPAQKPGSREYQLKAVFLYNFTQFVEWPSSSFSSDKAPMIIGILGTDPFGSYLEETVAGEKINGHPLLVQRYNSIEEAAECHVLFINVADKKEREQIMTKLKGRNILTVSDAPDFLEQGGMIRFFTRQGKIKLEVNLEQTKMANLVMSSKLLRLVEIYIAQKIT